MENVERHTHLPETERLSTIIALILLAFALAHFIRIPERELSIQLPGLYLGVPFGAQQLAALLAALLTASGADWLLRGHPHLETRWRIEHWLLPGVTAWAIGLPLLQLPLHPAWWIGFLFGGVLLTLVLIAEYIVVDPLDLRRAPAAAGLTAVSFALFLVLATGLKFAELRLFLLLPLTGLAIFLVSLRTLRLRLPDGWAFAEAGLVTLVTVQLAAPLHYWPIAPVSFGLFLLGPAYALTLFFGNLAEGKPLREAAIEPAGVLALVWGAALLIR